MRIKGRLEEGQEDRIIKVEVLSKEDLEKIANLFSKYI